MLKRVLPYVPYLVVIVSLIVAIFMVVKLNGEKVSILPKKVTSSHKTQVATQTAGNATNTSNPAYTVKTAPTPTLAPTPPSTKPTTTVAVTSGIKQTTTTKPATKTVVVTNTTPAPVVASNTQLTNTGPGEVIALFAISSLAATILHTTYLRKKITV